MAHTHVRLRPRQVLTIMHAYSFSGASYVSYLVQPSIASDIFPHRMRGLAQGYLYGIQAMGAVLAYMAGGALIENDSVNGWRCKPASFQILFRR